MPYLKPNVPYEDNRTTAEVSEWAFLALKRNHDSFSSSSWSSSKSNWMLTTTNTITEDGDGKALTRASEERNKESWAFASSKGETTTANVERLVE